MTEVHKLAGDWVYKHLQGSKEQLPDAAIETFAKAVLIATKGDGEVSQAERDWVIGLTAAKGASEAIIDKLKAYSADEDIAAVIESNPISNKSRINLIYTAIQASDSDATYNEGEKAAVRKIASKVGVSEDTIKQLESLYEEEKKLFEKKISILFPEGVV